MWKWFATKTILTNKDGHVNKDDNTDVSDADVVVAAADNDDNDDDDKGWLLIMILIMMMTMLTTTTMRIVTVLTKDKTTFISD